jgi:hypothetical protein
MLATTLKALLNRTKSRGDVRQRSTRTRAKSRPNASQRVALSNDPMNADADDLRDLPDCALALFEHQLERRIAALRDATIADAIMEQYRDRPDRVRAEIERRKRMTARQRAPLLALTAWPGPNRLDPFAVLRDELALLPDDQPEQAVQFLSWWLLLLSAVIEQILS